MEHGDPNEELKLLQVGAVTALGIPPDEQRAVVVGESGKAAVQACALADSATALSRLVEYPEAARAADTALAKSRELWTPTPADPYGDLDRPAGCLALDRGHLDVAEQFAVASMRRWEGGSQVRRTQSAIVLATIHVRAGEPFGLQLARRRLEPLAAALEARPGGDAKQLARMARQVATTRA